ncbi:transcription-repair coupling factor [Riemerella anatipestifer]|uniref:transcription-repair coupling factor n=1 Tax=Riemerella anatipestifer TaxID=34085 RepID=UPI0005712C64|nr:transcription-repair coupling factor [Riemerella anatipestifer]MCO7332433.1 transcription-repair coupling factor [Riemerella anatipestifer]MCO7351385.1 transcription-repair coupling factor [Riemerella anatipestifer]MCU7583230.1 transcription-repair coupling factor [Riemerella anatipestifer]MCW0488494.1 transcription-repair coupling factor [Riemerella anatipestifer]MDD1549456.1 transcription-repair coupling factor [Riemerella anatipestifer]
MILSPIHESLLPFLLKHQFGSSILKALPQHQHISVKGMAGSSPSLICAELFLTQNQPILLIVDDKEDAHYTTTELEELLGEDKVLYFPATHLEPYQTEKTQNANLVLRTEVLNQLNANPEPKVIVAHYAALCEKVLKKEDFKAISHHIKVGDQLDFDFTGELLEQFNFHLTDFVSEPGEFAVRGGIVDVFSYANDKPYRITFFGNEVESIKTFDIETQLSISKVESLQLVSNMNFAVQGTKVPFLDLLPKDSFIVTKNAYLGLNYIRDFYTKAEERYSQLNSDIKHQKPNELFISDEVFFKTYQKFRTVDFTSQSLQLPQAPFIELKQNPQPSFNKNFELLIEDLEEKQKQGFNLWISFSSEKQKERLKSIFEDLGSAISFQFFKSELHQGFIDHQHQILVYTDHQIFDRYQRYRAKNTFAKSEQLTLKDLMSLKVGDYIAHIDHGIGKFMGLVKVNNGGKTQECFKLTYKNGDLLYVSIHALHKISKYNGAEGKEITLSKIGSPSWKNLKNKTKAKVKQIAFDLIKLYAKRKTAKGFAYTPDTYLQNELEASFLYEDTPDQEKATLDVKRDMEADTIMDRLVCGDVGFGKTEVAIRAAFKATTDGKQVAVLVPTTILAFQHYRSFAERLKDFPVNISYLNRFRTAKQKRETLEKLAEGKIDIIIGTHQLASDKVKFKDLGLLIIDEEHKFGVSVKDKLKTLKANIDTLTLTATPIPRTLQFSLMAARDLSVIKTPPPNRQPVETQLIGFDEEIIRDAISYELQRDGQVYFINNRIDNLKDIAGMIQRLIPDARVITGHGQMDGKQLEENILDFMEGRYDVLVSTTIVESGVDVPNANTIFINDAQRFGMADVHQMRGRVGRSNRKAFCYLITPPFDMVTSDARKRLEAIEQFSDLGSGFQIAMKDLEIRGAGDLLGAEQSGFINEMGFETYQKIMQEALEELQNDAEFESLFENEADRKKLFKSSKDVNIDTDLELMLPDSYVSSTEERLSLYQKLSEINNKEELKRFEAELEDRFGSLPEEAINLLKSVELKWLAAAIGFEKIIMKNGIFLGYFPSNPQDKFYQTEKFKKIIQYLSQNPQKASLKEKHSAEGNQLMMRKEHINDVDEVNELLQAILN